MDNTGWINFGRNRVIVISSNAAVPKAFGVGKPTDEQTAAPVEPEAGSYRNSASDGLGHR